MSILDLSKRATMRRPRLSWDQKGGPGSGFHNDQDPNTAGPHRGIPGHHGGSLPADVPSLEREEQLRTHRVLMGKGAQTLMQKYKFKKEHVELAIKPDADPSDPVVNFFRKRMREALVRDEAQKKPTDRRFKQDEIDRLLPLNQQDKDDVGTIEKFTEQFQREKRGPEKPKDSIGVRLFKDTVSNALSPPIDAGTGTDSPGKIVPKLSTLSVPEQLAYIRTYATDSDGSNPLAEQFINVPNQPGMTVFGVRIERNKILAKSVQQAKKLQPHKFERLKGSRQYITERDALRQFTDTNQFKRSLDDTITRMEHALTLIKDPSLRQPGDDVDGNAILGELSSLQRIAQTNPNISDMEKKRLVRAINKWRTESQRAGIRGRISELRQNRAREESTISPQGPTFLSTEQFSRGSIADLIKRVDASSLTDTRFPFAERQEAAQELLRRVSLSRRFPGLMDDDLRDRAINSLNRAKDLGLPNLSATESAIRKIKQNEGMARAQLRSLDPRVEREKESVIESQINKALADLIRDPQQFNKVSKETWKTVREDSSFQRWKREKARLEVNPNLPLTEYSTRVAVANANITVDEEARFKAMLRNRLTGMSSSNPPGPKPTRKNPNRREEVTQQNRETRRREILKMSDEDIQQTAADFADERIKRMLETGEVQIGEEEAIERERLRRSKITELQRRRGLS